MTEPRSATKPAPLIHPLILLLESLGVPPPYYVFVSVVGATDFEFERPATDSPGGFYTSKADRHIITVPEVVVSNLGAPAHTILRPAIDMIWNAFGLPGSELFDDLGNWRG